MRPRTSVLVIGVLAIVQCALSRSVASEPRQGTASGAHPPQDTSSSARSSPRILEIFPSDSSQAASFNVDSAMVVGFTCTLPGIKVFADSQYVGTAPFTAFSRVEGEHILRYVPPDSGRWPSTAVVETLTFRRGGRLVRTLGVPSTCHLTTEPYGATVRRDGVELGVTPLDVQFTSTKSLVTLEKAGFETATVPLSGGEPWIHLLLHPKEGVPADPQALYLGGEQSKNMLPIYVTTGATVITGTAAAILKIKADNRYDDYRQSGDARALTDVRRLDLASGVSLALSELSLVGLAYFLLSH